MNWEQLLVADDEETRRKVHMERALGVTQRIDQIDMRIVQREDEAQSESS